MSLHRRISGASCATVFSVLAIVVGSGMSGAGDASAAIRCSKGFQSVGGSLIATPYCQDQLVADVARGYGIRVSGREIRNNPNRKRHVCQFIGRDVRVQMACIDAFPVGRRPF